MLTQDQKIYHQSRDLVESNPLVISAKLYDLPFRNARGGVVTTPPGRSCYEKWPGRARVNTPIICFNSKFNCLKLNVICFRLGIKWCNHDKTRPCLQQVYFQQGFSREMLHCILWNACNATNNGALTEETGRVEEGQNLSLSVSVSDLKKKQSQKIDVVDIIHVNYVYTSY